MCTHRYPSIYFRKLVISMKEFQLTVHHDEDDGDVGNVGDIFFIIKLFKSFSFINKNLNFKSFSRQSYALRESGKIFLIAYPSFHSTRICPWNSLLYLFDVYIFNFIFFCPTLKRKLTAKKTTTTMKMMKSQWEEPNMKKIPFSFATEILCVRKKTAISIIAGIKNIFFIFRIAYF